MSRMTMTASQYAEFATRMAKVNMLSEKEAEKARQFARLEDELSFGRSWADVTVSMPQSVLEDLVGAEADRDLGL